MDTAIEHDLKTGITRVRELTMDEQTRLDQERQIATLVESERKAAEDRRKQQLKTSRAADRDNILDAKDIAGAVADAQLLTVLLVGMTVKIQRLEAEIVELRRLDA